MQNVTDLRNKLIIAYDGISSGTLPVGKARELAKAANNIIATAKMQLVYAALRRETPQIPFLGTPQVIEAEETAK